MINAESYKRLVAAKRRAAAPSGDSVPPAEDFSALSDADLRVKLEGLYAARMDAVDEASGRYGRIGPQLIAGELAIYDRRIRVVEAEMQRRKPHPPAPSPPAERGN